MVRKRSVELHAEARDELLPGGDLVGFDPQSLTHHAALEVGADPARWTDDDVVYVLARRGFDTAGNLIVGEPALRLHQQSLLAPARPLRANLAAAYARQADRVVATGVAGSSAAGEFPKFTAVREPGEPVAD